MKTRRRSFALLVITFAVVGLLASDALLAGKGGGGKPPKLSLTVTIFPTSIAEGETATGTVSHNNADTSSAVEVTLTSSDTTAASGPSSVTILAGQSSATFDVDALTGPQTVTITSSADGYLSANAILTVTAPPPVRYALHRFSMPNDYVIGNVVLRDINDVGEVVGYYVDAFVAEGEQPFYLDIASGNTVATNLNDVQFDADYGIPDGWYIDAAQGINNWGQIAAAVTKVGEPDLLRGCVIELRPDPTDLTVLPRLHLIPEPADWPHTYAHRINDEGVVLGGDTYLDVTYVFQLGDTDIQVIPEPFDLWRGGSGVHLTNPVNDGPSLVKVALGNEVLTYDVESGTSIFTTQDDEIHGFNDYEHYCGVYVTQGKGNKFTRTGFVFDGVFRSLDDMVDARNLNNDGDVIGRSSGSGGRALLDHAQYGPISLDETIVAVDEQEQAIWDASSQAWITLSERDATGFPVVSGTIRRGTTGAIFYDGYVLVPIE